MVVGVLMVWPVQGRRWWTAVPAGAALPGRFREASGLRLEGGDGEGVEQVEEEQDAEGERWGWGKGWTARRPRKSRWEGEPLMFVGRLHTPHTATWPLNV